jgi:hypothetical protein
MLWTLPARPEARPGLLSLMLWTVPARPDYQFWTRPARPEALDLLSLLWTLPGLSASTGPPPARPDILDLACKA